MYVNTSLIVRLNPHKVDLHEKNLITQINVCIHKYQNSYNCMYTQSYLEKNF